MKSSQKSLLGFILINLPTDEALNLYLNVLTQASVKFSDQPKSVFNLNSLLGIRFFNSETDLFFNQSNTKRSIAGEGPQTNEPKKQTDEFYEAIPNSSIVSVDEARREEMSFYIMPSYLFSTLNGESKSNGAKLQLLSTEHYRLDLGASLKTKKWEMSVGIEGNWLKFETPRSGRLLNQRLQYNRIKLQHSYSLSPRFKLESFLSYGEDLLHRNNAGSVELFKLQSVAPLIGVSADLYRSKKSIISFKALGGHSFVTNDQNTSSKGGINSFAELSFSSKREKFDIQVGVFYDAKKAESQDFQQDLMSSGLFFKIGF